ncbi:hypothetical protein [Anaeromyxobacter diazotrophicus]|uniref:Uncharacterized protein n=1 Tax=Anaeromyxobacter diazotrophicus TaxID=2590199 RepID=A0A7I9VJT7_9BACT|nr:hypothetical protein [Anaeromyxobacter diazotrophicus]GEJ56643.1 hypothetical protein AMYX_13840 [Anaeromyxobacter diazotrophicus]
MNDLDTIGLTPDSRRALTELEAKGWFQDGQDAARFCMAYAIRAKLPEGVTEDRTTQWAAGNFDKSGEIRALLAALYPDCQTPVRLMEHFVNQGLVMVAARVRSDAVGPAELLAD